MPDERPIYPCHKNDWCDLWDDHDGPCIDEGVRVLPDDDDHVPTDAEILADPDAHSGWVHARCERCWVEMEPGRWPVRAPFTKGEAMLCCWCGNPTWVGIYVRAEPASPPHCHHAHSKVLRLIPQPDGNG